ncbi:MAG: molybdopterin-dependent oxidoreductase [Thermomicrobiales bacterium]
MILDWLRRLPNLVAGVLAGALAAVVMTLAMAASRYWLGIMPPVEAIPDRVSALLSINTFFSLFGKYGGYNGLKQFGILSGLRGVLAVGIVVGVLYALVVESVPSRRSRRWMRGTSLPALLFVAIAGFVAWIGLVIFLWSDMASNFRGLPFTWARITSVAAYFIWIALFIATLIASYRFMTRRPLPTGTIDTAPVVVTPTTRPLGQPLSRRAIGVAAIAALLTWPIYWLLKRMYNEAVFPYDGTVNSGEGVTPITPIDHFYTVTKNVVDPNVNRDIWRLEVGGHVNKGVSYSYDDLQKFDQVDQETTLMCISNKIGAGLFSNANWRGVRLHDVLQASGVKDGAFDCFVHGADGYRDSFTIAKAMEETTLVVYQINGEPLPRRHGYPVRLVVPGMYGEKNVKWVTRIDISTKDEKGFYEEQGWGPDFVPKTRSDIFFPRTRLTGKGFIFTPSAGNEFKVGKASQVKGRAFAADRGIKGVEFSVDNGATWAPAEIYYPGTKLTWSLWRFEWTPEKPGDYVLLTRATDDTGAAQPSESRGIVPQGAQGYQKVTATVS